MAKPLSRGCGWRPYPRCEDARVDGLVRLDEIEAARELLRDVAVVTPVEGSRPLSRKVGGDVLLKCENLQRTGSFKIRGAYVRIVRLTDEERARGVVAASAGNHAQGVALAASLTGAKSKIFMPAGAPLPKIEATKAYGADIELTGLTVDDALVAARAYAEDHGAVLIHPFDHRDVIAGQGTVGLEIADAVPQARTVVVCMGGGGLVSGVAAAVKARLSGVRVVAVQAEAAAAFPHSLAVGHPVALETMSTIADGIAVATPGEITLRHVAQLVDDVVTVSEESLSRALLLCLERAKLVVEPAGVAAVAAISDDPGAFEPPVVAVLSGGNMDPVLLMRVIRHGMIAAGRYLSFRLRIPDHPGELARLLALLADTGSNVLDVEHLRTGPKLHLDEVEVALQLETRGPDHCDEVLGRLRAAGYPLLFG
ncbi:MAG TPA: threonine ammonia-lyase [Mycobacteriales bacterium]|nr:threonine ammonia-lyase [Mycobacteriales bacterium]